MFVGVKQQGAVVFHSYDLVSGHQKLSRRVTAGSKPAKASFELARRVEALAGKVYLSLQSVEDRFGIVPTISGFKLAERLQKDPKADFVFSSSGRKGLEIWDLEVSELV